MHPRRLAAQLPRSHAVVTHALRVVRFRALRCIDAQLLVMVYEHVRLNTLRGRFLAKAPLVLVGVYTEQTSDATSYAFLASAISGPPLFVTVAHMGQWASTAPLSILTWSSDAVV